MSNGKSIFAFLLFLVVGSGACSLDVVAETTPTERTTPATTKVVTPLSSSSATSIETISTQPILTSSTNIIADLSPAWIEAEQMKARLFTIDASDNEGVLVEKMEDLRLLNNYWQNNPNVISSSPLGALCWIYHELKRGEVLDFLRQEFDQLVDEIVDSLGIVNENSNDDNTVDFLLDFLTKRDAEIEDIGPVNIIDEDKTMADIPVLSTGPVTESDDDELTNQELLSFYRTPIMIEWIRVNNTGAGDGTEWASAIQSVARPEVKKFVMRNKLSTKIGTYADALFQAVHDYISSGQTEPSDFYESTLPGYNDFIEAAKYSPDCKRLSYSLR